ncbi:Actin- protein 6 [Ceratobasidium sp. 370]|nr:Actin- protein 6 [Ceratobasidium sp. 370]
MTESTHVINLVKEQCCFVSRNFAKDLEICRSNLTSNPIAQSYVLPNFASEPPRPGYVRTPASPALSESDTVLPMNNECFVVPEVLFQPSDVGLAQKGLVETVANSIESLPEEMRGVAWANIGLVGGNCLFDGFDGLRALAPSDYEVCLYRARNPITSTFYAAHTLARSPIFPSLCITRAEYLERGTAACRRKFANVNWFAGSDADATTEKRELGAGRKDKKGSLLGKETGRRKPRGEAAGGEEASVGDNKIRDAFIQSTKSKSPSAAPAIQKSPTPVDDGSSDNENNLNENDEDSTAIEGDPALLARMEKSMQDALDEGEAEDESDDEGLSGCQPTPPSSSARLPDSIFAAAAVEERKLERKRTKTAQSREANPKRRRVREGASERVIRRVFHRSTSSIFTDSFNSSGRTLRVVKALDVPPPPPSRASHRKGAGIKGGTAFRRKWKQRDALQAQIRSRSGPAQKFATAK